MANATQDVHLASKRRDGGGGGGCVAANRDFTQKEFHGDFARLESGLVGVFRRSRDPSAPPPREDDRPGGPGAENRFRELELGVERGGVLDLAVLERTRAPVVQTMRWGRGVGRAPGRVAAARPRRLERVRQLLGGELDDAGLLVAARRAAELTPRERTPRPRFGPARRLSRRGG